ncbi:MAG TPA: glycosyltransferase family 1 protein [Gemmatimonadales bacterium]|nr:glycosyltransferase family 1 protein [Gemmatimonadales bacterium]
MRISLITDTYLPEVNGVTTVLATMRQGLRARGHEVQVIAPAYDRPGPDDEGVIRRWSLRFPPYPQMRLSLPVGGDVRRALTGFRPDIVHVATEGPLGTLGRRAALASGIPLVTSFHTDFPRYAERYLGQWAVGPVQGYLRRFHAPAYLTQTPSQTTRDELAVLGFRRPVVWGRGVDTRLFHPAHRSVARRAALGVNDDTPIVLHVSRLAVEKDVGTLVAAFRAAHAELGDRARFIVAGDGPEGAMVRSALPFATHYGFIDRTRLAEVYADSDLFIFPSPTETCGLVVLEAMASGLPVITSDRGGVLENVRHALNGVMVPAGDHGAFTQAIVDLVELPRGRAAMASAARAFAVARDWDRELDQLEPMYRAAIDAAA